MPTNYKINGTDIEDIFESFTLAEQSEGGVTDSKFSDGSGRFKQNGADLKTALGKTFPTSAGSYIGGANSTTDYTAAGAAIDVALKGCRPIGIQRANLGVGTWYINRVNGQTWVSSSPNSASGTRLDHDPKFIFLELQGGGGGGAGSGLTGCSGGGGAGGYCFVAAEIPDGSYLRIVVGAGGAAGGDDANGSAGGATTLYNASGSIIAQANGGNGGNRRSDNTASGGTASGGLVNITGGYGGGKEDAGGAVSAFTVTLPKPEQTQWTRGGFSGGSSGGNNYGGAGGASAFAAGANGDSRQTPSSAGKLGSGGAGAGYQAFQQHAGTAGGDGFARIYY